MKKYKVAFEVEVYAHDVAEGYREAMARLIDVMDKHNHQRLPEALERAGELPNGGIEGEGHANDRLSGWRVVWDVREG